MDKTTQPIRHFESSAGCRSAAALAAGLSAAAPSQTSGASPDNRPIAYPHSVAFGAYDPWGDFANDTRSRSKRCFFPGRTSTCRPSAPLTTTRTSGDAVF